MYQLREFHHHLGIDDTVSGSVSVCLSWFTYRFALRFILTYIAPMRCCVYIWRFRVHFNRLQSNFGFILEQFARLIWLIFFICQVLCSELCHSASSELGSEWILFKHASISSQFIYVIIYVFTVRCAYHILSGLNRTCVSYICVYRECVFRILTIKMISNS